MRRLLLLATLTSAVRRAAHDALPPEAASAFAAHQKPFVAALAARRPGVSSHSAPAPRAFGGRPQPLLRPQATTTAAPELPSLSSLLDPLGGARKLKSVAAVIGYLGLEDADDSEEDDDAANVPRLLTMHAAE